MIDVKIEPKRIKKRDGSNEYRIDVIVSKAGVIHEHVGFVYCRDDLDSFISQRRTAAWSVHGIRSAEQVLS